MGSLGDFTELRRQVPLLTASTLGSRIQGKKLIYNLTDCISVRHLLVSQLYTTAMTANSRAPASAESGTFTRLGPLPNSYTSDLGLQRMLGCASLFSGSPGQH